MTDNETNPYDAQIARIDAMLAALKSLNPLERAELDRMLKAGHQAQVATALTNRVLGK